MWLESEFHFSESERAARSLGSDEASVAGDPDRILYKGYCSVLPLTGKAEVVWT